ncbi:hypothetical protein [Bacteroides sp. HF-162]|uniref:hypothetical protein n=1 Tax=Bacteroides sp. HF-162 TaxID=2785531 RepID=UPI001E50A2B7|nr:hypothetical protein [Bacteroides sp. HF-162]
MNIIQQPDMLSLSMNLKNFIIGSSRQTTFTLKAGDKELVSQVYAPDENGVMEIDIHEIVHSFLSYSLKDIGEVYQQTNLVADFTAVIDSTEITFRVIRSGVDRLTDSATNFLTQNFLTWQPNVKPVTYYSPEFLTYYAVVAGTVKLRAYFTDESGTVKSQTDYTVTELMPGIAYTMPLQYSVVAGWLGHKLPAYYDVWVENTSGQRLTYIQRYYAEDMRSEQEQWVLFENSLGGIDTFRAYGVTTLNGEHTHNIAETDECFQEYRVDTERKFQKNTGYLNDNERKWLLDFFPSQKKYLYAGNYLRQIVVMESNVSFTDRDIPSNYTFTFKYADARPLLNLPRTDLPADILNITVPEVGSFTVPPRLAEFSRLPLSEGALFPIQNPYSEEWSTTNVAAIGYYLADFLSRIFGSGGGVGHKHRNYDLLELLSYIEGYLLVNGQKIKAGYADKAGSVDGMEDMFLHKDRADGTPFPITFGDWVKFGEFLTGISGGCIDKNGILEMEEGIFRKRLFVPEIAYNRVTYFKGRMCASPGGGCTVKEWSDNGDGSYTITPDLTDADGLSQFVDDILTTYFVTKNAEGKLQGFEEMKFRVTSADYTAKTFVMTPKPGTDWKPGDAMVLAQTGNFTDEDRQTYILIDTVNGNNCITFFDHANTWDVEPAQEMSWIGKKKGRTVHGIPADNYSAVFRHVIMSGKIFQVDDITGEAFRVPLFKGTWQKGEKYAYYDEVTHNGSSWICVNEKGTSTEPADGNADWLKYAAKGESGKGIKSTDVEYAISVSNVIAPVDGWQTTSPEWEAGKYIWSRTKIVYSDGEVKYTQAACISGGQGADGKGIKSITEEYYLSSSSATTTGGKWQTTSPAWKNGWYIWTRTRIVFTDGTTTTTNAICVTGSKGADGTSITNCGNWQTGKHIPYMGITKMAGRVFFCIAPDGTDNPPMWTQTTNEGRRILQTQNGGKSYGYTITGDLNTAEYELLVENGQDGKDGKGYEWIFKHTTENVTPPTPATSQVDDYVPSGWHDDPIGVSESLPYEWACCRTKKDGVWSAFSPAAIWAKWGFDGESAIVADFDNEMESIALTYEGKTVAQSVLKTTVGMWYGTQKLQLKSISCVTPAGVTESYNVNTGVIAFTVASGISMPARSEVRITVTATVQDTDISRELVFTITGVRAGNPGSDAILYRLVPSVSSVSKRKDGTYSVAGVSCTRTKSVGGSTAVTTDGVLKYSKDGGSEVEIQNGTAISPKNFTTQLQFVFYVGGQVVDRETIPMVVDGTDGNPGKPGGDGESVKAGGEWRTANTPYKKLTICTMGSRSWLSKVDTSNPPLWTQTTHDGRRITQTQNGGKSYGYIITEEVNTDEWEQLTQDGGMVYLISTCSNIRVSSAGSLVPSAFRVYAKRTLGSATLTYPDGYLAARGYSNGIWSAIAGPSRASEITVNASAGYSTFSVRCYQSQADASAWNDSFIAEISVGVSYDGASGRDASEPRPRGFFAKGNTYVWNEDYHDIVLATFNNRTIPFRVRAYGTSVTVAPTSIDGDANWEAAQQYMFVAMDMALIRKIRADEIYVDDLVVQNVLARDKTGKAMCQIDGENGGIGFLAGGNIRWDAKGNVFQDASIFRKLKLLEPKSDVNEYYLDFDTGLNFEISRIFSLPTLEETIYLPNAAEYEGGECMLYNGGVYTRLTGPASIKVAGGGSFIIDGEYYSKIIVPSLSIAQFKAVATYSDGVKDEVKWVLISGKAESKT